MAFQCQMRSRRSGSVSVVFVGLVAVLALVVGSGMYFLRRTARKTDEVILTTTALRGPFENIVLEQGEIESSSNVEVVCEVESRNSGGTAILWVAAEGTQVKPGDRLVELDSSALEQELKQQRIMVNSAHAAKVTAESALEQANVAMTEYLEGTFKQEEKTIQSEILIAEEKLSRAKETAKFSERLAALGFQTTLQLKADQFAVEQAQVELDLANGKLTTLQDITKKKMMIQLEAAIATAEAQLEAATNSYDEEMKKLAEIEHQISKCVINATQGGVVIHANKTSSRGNAEFVVEPGALVREQQVIIRLPDPTKMQVKANINEARVPQVKEGMPVAIRIGALEDATLSGVVTKVNKYAEPTSWFSNQVKEYATHVQILSPPPVIRSGMTAEIRIFVDRRSNELQIPVQTLYQHKGHLFCLVKNGNSYETREVTIAGTNDTTVVVASGVEENDEVVMNPRAHRQLLQLPDLPDPPRDVPNAAIELASGSGEFESQDPNRREPEPDSDSDSREPDRRDAGSLDSPVDSSPSDTRTTLQSDGTQTTLSGLLERSDANGDGLLSAAEIASLPDYQRQLLQRADADGDGDLNQAELLTVIQENSVETKTATDVGGGGGE